MKSITLSSKNQIVIPSSARAKLGIVGGDKLVIEKVTNSQIVLRKEPSYHELLGSVSGQTPDPVDRVRKLRSRWR